MTPTSGNSATYFTILPSDAGFTDQLLQFKTFYELGLSLEYNYLHSVFSSNRSGSEGIYDFLGFNEQFSSRLLTEKSNIYRRMGVNNTLGYNKLSWHKKLRNKIRFHSIHRLYFNQYNFIDIGLGDKASIDSQGNDPLEALRSMICAIVEKKSTTHPRRKNVVRFYLTGGEYFFRVLAPLLNQRQPFFSDGLDLLSLYLQRRQLQPIVSKYTEGKLKILVHVRLGDTAVIETPWGSYIPLWAWHKIYPLKEYPNKNDKIFRKLMDVEDFAAFIDHYFQHLDPDLFSVVVASDGYQTSYRELFKRATSLGLTSDRISILHDAQNTYENDKFSVFNQYNHCELIVGETNENLQELVHHAIYADIVIVGCHQRMIPKLLSTYCSNEGSPTIVIALHNGIEPLYAEQIGLVKTKALVYPVNINQLGSGDELRTVTEAIQRLCM